MKIANKYLATQIQSEIIAGYLASSHEDYIGQVSIKTDKIDCALLNFAIQKLYARHEVLRTAFDWQHQNGIQAVVADSLPNGEYINHYYIESLEEFSHIKSKESQLINLNKPPLIRIAIVQNNTDYYILWTRHHAITDQKSLEIFWVELWSLYENPALYLEPVLPYSEFAKKNTIFVKSRSKCINLFLLPHAKRAKLNLELNNSEFVKVKSICKSANITLAAFCFSAFAYSVKSFFNDSIPFIGFVESVRPIEFSKTMGPFIKSSLISLDRLNEANIGKFRANVFNQILKARVESSAKEPHSGILQNSTNISFLFEEDLGLISLQTLEESAGIEVRLKIFCRVCIHDDCLKIELASQTSLIRNDDLQNILQVMKKSLLTNNDYSLFTNINEFASLDDLLWESWKSQDSIIVRDCFISLNGSSLYQRVLEQVDLINCKIKDKTNGCLIIEPDRSLNCVVNILASIKLDCPFLLVPNFIESADCTKLIDGVSFYKPAGLILPLNLAYLIQTSGTSGTRKIVMIKKKNLINHLIYRRKYNEYSSNVALTSSWIFDASLTVLFSTMIKGGCLSILPLVSDFDSPENYFNLLCSHNINEINMVPSLLHLLCEYGLKRTFIHIITSAGEELNPKLAKTILTQSNIKLINEYGPSECTILSSRYLVTIENLDQEIPIPIGFSPDGVCIQLIPNDDGMNEIIIGGDSVGAGYLNDQDKNYSAFFFDQGKTWYRTGDYGSINSDGSFNWLGRADNHLKINGKMYNSRYFESEMNKIGALDSVCILGNPHSYMYYTGQSIGEKEVKTLSITWRQDLGISISMLELDTIPRNLSGKVDLRLLKEKADLITLSANASISKATHHLLVENIIDRPVSLDSCPMNDLDSLALLKLIASINNKFSLKMSVSEISTLASWHQFLQLIDINLISLPSKSPLVNKIVRQRREYQ